MGKTNLYFRKHIKIIIPIVLIFSLIIGYVSGYIMSTKGYFFNNLTKAINRENTKKLSEIISYNGTEENLIPLIDYLKLDNNKTNFIDSLKKNGTYNGFTLVEHKGIFFTKYNLEVNPINISIKVNYPSEIYLNDLDLGETDNNKEIKTTKSIPGLYKIIGKTSNEYGDIETSKELSIFKDTEVALNIEGNSITINSPYGDGKVYINNDAINKRVSDIKDFSFFSSDEKNKLYFSYDFPWGTIKSEEVSIGKYPEISPKINLVNNKLREDVKSSIDSFYDSVIEALNKGDMNLIKSVPENLKFSIYSDLTKKYFILKNTYILKDINISLEEESFKLDSENKYQGKVLVTLSYSTSKNIAGLTFSETVEEKAFITICEYIDGQWNIVSLNKN